MRRTARKEKVGEGLVRRCVTEEIGERLGAREVTETPEFIGLDEFSVRRRHLYHTAICNLVKGEAKDETYSETDIPCLRVLRGLLTGKRQG